MDANASALRRSNELLRLRTDALQHTLAMQVGAPDERSGRVR